MPRGSPTHAGQHVARSHAARSCVAEPDLIHCANARCVPWVAQGRPAQRAGCGILPVVWCMPHQHVDVLGAQAQAAAEVAELRDALKRVSQQLEAAEARNTNERRDAAAEKARLQVGVVALSFERGLLSAACRSVVLLPVACCLLPVVLDEKEAAEKHLSCDAWRVWLAA
jgi:hypothetical protein